MPVTDAPPLPVWEYRVVKLDEGHEQVLNMMGAGGWELVCITGGERMALLRAFMKRQKR